MPEQDEGRPAGEAAQTAYDVILRLILAGDLPAGQRLREQALAERVGVSRTPVRQALNRLAVEGLVTLNPNRSATVVEFTEEDVTGILDLRARFEAYAAGLAVPRLEAEHIDRLAELAAAMEELVRGDFRTTELSALNSEFHAIFIDHCGNRHLASTIRTLVRPVMMVRTFDTYTPEALRRSQQHHAELVEASRARDGVWAESVMRSHIRAARHAHRRLTGRDEPLPEPLFESLPEPLPESLPESLPEQS